MKMEPFQERGRLGRRKIIWHLHMPKKHLYLEVFDLFMCIRFVKKMSNAKILEFRPSFWNKVLALPNIAIHSQSYRIRSQQISITHFHLELLFVDPTGRE